MKEREDCLGDIRMATRVVNVLVFLLVFNLFLGWMFFHPFLWIFLELFIIFMLLSFIRVRKKLKKEMS